MNIRYSGKTLYYNSGAMWLTKALSRHLTLNLGECMIVAHGEVKGTDRPFIVKLRVE
jgi:hypothetical protein